MPPCENVLRQKIQRTHILTAIIKNARNKLIDLDLTDGWCIDDDMKLKI